MDRKYFAFDLLVGGVSKECTLLKIYCAILDNDLNVLNELEFDIAPPEYRHYVVDTEVLERCNLDLVKHCNTAVPSKTVSEQVFRLIYGYTRYGQSLLTPLSCDLEYNAQMLTTKLVKSNVWQQCMANGIDVLSIAINEQRKGTLPNTLELSLSNLVDHFKIADIDMNSPKSRVLATIEILKKL